MSYVFDYASARPTQAQLAGAGAVATSRYVKKSLPNSFDLSAAERAQNLAWGLGQMYNAEQTASDIIGQSPQWWSDYGKYVADRLQGYGVDPRGVNVAASADCYVSPGNLPTVMNNLSAFAVGVEPFGMIGYGQISVIDLLVNDGISPSGAKHWLTAALSWSGYPNTAAGWNEYMTYPHAGMVQMLGSNLAGTDMNIPIDLPAMGFEWPESSPYYQGDQAMSMWVLNHPTIGEWLISDSFAYHLEQGGTVTNLTAPGTGIPLVSVPNTLEAQNIIDKANQNANALSAILAQLKLITPAFPTEPGAPQNFTFTGTATATPPTEAG